MSASTTAKFLVEARRDRRLLDGLPEDLRPRDIEEAYAVQDALVPLLAEHGSGGPVGFKVGCANEAAMELLGADRPFWGRLLAENVFEVVGHRYADFVGTGVPSLVADNALNAAWVAGAPIDLGTGAPDLSDVPVEVYVDDVLQATGSAENVLGHPPERCRVAW